MIPDQKCLCQKSTLSMFFPPFDFTGEVEQVSDLSSELLFALELEQRENIISCSLPNIFHNTFKMNKTIVTIMQMKLEMK